MKKLMIAAAIVCAAAMAQAAATTWTANTSSKIWYDGYKGNGDNSKAITISPTVYLIAAAIDADGTGVGITQANLVKAFKDANGAIDLADYAVKGSAGATLSSAGKLTGTGHKIAQFDNPDDFTPGNNYSFYLATLVPYDNKNYLYVSDAQPVQAKNTGSVATIGDIDPGASTKKLYDAGADYSAAGWYTTAAVPEPTSGLLLLLGMAGLALRRRRA